MKPIHVSVRVDRPREEVFAFLDVLANHEQFCDHMLVDWSFSGPAAGVGARARMRANAPGPKDGPTWRWSPPSRRARSSRRPWARRAGAAPAAPTRSRTRRAAAPTCGSRSSTSRRRRGADRDAAAARVAPAGERQGDGPPRRDAERVTAASPLDGRTALVTGASSGIGRALALALGRAGCTVAVPTARAHGGGGRRAEAGGRAFGADLADAGTEALARRGGRPRRIDILVPGAGVGVRCVLEDVGADLWTRTMDVNVRAPFLLAQAIVPGMARRGFGRVLLLSSIAAFTGGRVGPHYAASKAALNGLTH